MTTTAEGRTYTRDDMARAWSEGYTARMSVAALAELHGGAFAAPNPYVTESRPQVHIHPAGLGRGGDSTAASPYDKPNA